MHNRTIYDSAFNIFKTQQQLSDKLGDIGLTFEYGQGVVGVAFDQLISDTETIILECLGLTVNHQIHKKCQINGAQYPISVDVFYCENMDDTFAITADDFSEFFFKAVNDEHVRDLMWKAIVDKDKNAKTEYNNLRIGTIGLSF